MNGEGLVQPELPNFISVLEGALRGTPWAAFLGLWANVIFSLVIVALILAVALLASRRPRLVPGRLQNAVEVFVEGVDSFVCGVMGPRGRKFTPFIGTLFIYILCMNLAGLVPFMKSPTSSWSTTLALALCVFVTVQYTAVKELGLFGYLDVLAERPRGAMALSVVFPLLMLFLHVVSELVKPITLSLRLRSNIWGDDLLLAVLARFGILGVPLLLLSTVLTIIAAIVQAVVFCLLTTIYFALILVEEEGGAGKGPDHEEAGRLTTVRRKAWISKSHFLWRCPSRWRSPRSDRRSGSAAP